MTNSEVILLVACGVSILVNVLQAWSNGQLEEDLELERMDSQALYERIKRMKSAKCAHRHPIDFSRVK